jgi:hypothetical protein
MPQTLLGWSGTSFLVTFTVLSITSLRKGRD